MNRAVFPFLLTSLALLIAGCGESAGPAGPGVEPSANWEAVAARLQTGGLVYAIVDIDGDLESLIDEAQELVRGLADPQPGNPQLMWVNLDYQAIVAGTGLTSVTAFGASSVRTDTGFHNRTFVYTRDGPQGLLTLFGAESGPFAFPAFTPAGTDLLVEQRLDGESLVAVAQSVARLAAGDSGPGMVTNLLNMPLPNAPVTGRMLVDGLSGQITLIADLDPSDTIPLPEFGPVRRVHALLRLENGAPLAQAAVQAAGMQGGGAVDGDWTIVTLPLAELPYSDPTICWNSATGELFLASSLAYLERCRGLDEAPLTEDPEFVEATAGLPADGVAITYVSTETSDVIERSLERIVELAAAENDVAPESMVSLLVGPNLLFKSFIFEHPIASVTTVDTEGIFTAANWHYSQKTALVYGILGNPAVIGAVAGFGHLRTSGPVTVSRNKAQEAAIRRIEPVAGEHYPDLVTREGIDAELMATLPDGTVVRARD